MQVEKKTLSCKAEIKAIGDDTGEFEGYGSVFGVVDSYDEVVEKGAFSKSLKDKMPVLLWQHDWRSPIGVYAEAREDQHGLFLKGKLNLEVQQGREAYALLKQGAFKGLSIGFRTLKDRTDRATGLRHLEEVELMEVSLVTFPANEDANVDSVKSAPENIRDFEKFLREAGYSKEDAKLIASKGYSALEIRREGGDFALAQASLQAAVTSMNQLRKSLPDGGYSKAHPAR